MDLQLKSAEQQWFFMDDENFHQFLDFDVHVREANGASTRLLKVSVQLLQLLRGEEELHLLDGQHLSSTKPPKEAKRMAQSSLKSAQNSGETC